MSSFVRPATAHAAMSNLQGQIEHSLETLNALTSANVKEEKQVPPMVIRQAKAIVFLTQIKAGLIWSGKVGGGIIIRHLPDGRWSAPSSLSTTGVGFGFQVGAQKTDTMITLYDESSIATFAGKGQLKLGGDLAIAAGPVGRSATVDAGLGDGGFQGSFGYSHSQGVYGGLSLEGGSLSARPQDNENFYGREVTVEELLSGDVPPPGDPSSAALYKALDEICQAAGEAPLKAKTSEPTA